MIMIPQLEWWSRTGQAFEPVPLIRGEEYQISRSQQYDVNVTFW